MGLAKMRYSEPSKLELFCENFNPRIWKAANSSNSCSTHSLIPHFSLRIFGPQAFKGFLKFYFQLEDSYFTILWWFLPYINMNQSLVYTCPVLLKPSSHLPLHPTPSRLSQSTSLWISCIIQRIPTGYLFYIMYIFQYYSLKSSHPLPPTLWP